MLEVWKVIVIAVGSALFIVATSIPIVVWIVRRKHRQCMEKLLAEERAIRESQQYQTRQVGSSDGTENTPRARMPSQRSFMPYRPHEWTIIGSQERLYHSNPPIQSPQPKAKHERNRHSLTLSVRPRKAKKAIALVQLQQRSPLSAITERSHTNSIASPNIDVVSELPTHITPKATPERDGMPDEDKENNERPVSTTWPLPRSNRNSTADSVRQPLDTIEGSIPGGNPLIRPLIGERSFSQASGNAPDEPLPPLPSNVPAPRYPSRRGSKLRISTVSIDSANTSILDDAPTSSHPDTDLTPISLLSPGNGFRREEGTAPWDASSFPRLASPPGHPAIRGLRMKDVSHGSFQAIIGRDSVSRMTSGSRQSDMRYDLLHTRRRSGSVPLQSLRENQDTPLSRTGSVLSLDLPRGQTSTEFLPHRSSSAGPSPYRSSQRHSMFADLNQQYANSSILQNVSGNHAGPYRASHRPASISGSGPFHWDQKQLLPAKPSAMRDSNGIRKGHRRQNCVRISNLPPITIGSGPILFPPTEEEPEEPNHHHERKIPGLTLLDDPRFNRHSNRSMYEPLGSNLNRQAFEGDITPRRHSQRDMEDDFFRTRPDSGLSTLFQVPDAGQWPFSKSRISQSGRGLRSNNPYYTNYHPSNEYRPASPSSPSTFHFSRPLHTQPSPRSCNSPTPSIRVSRGLSTNMTYSPVPSRPQSRASSKLSKPNPRSQLPPIGSGREMYRSGAPQRMNSDVGSHRSISTRNSRLYMNMGGSPSRQSNTAMNLSRLNLMSPTAMSMGGGSIWEDTSIDGSPTSLKMSDGFGDMVTNPNKRKAMTTEVWGSDGRVTKAQSPFATPKGKGLGLMPWGTPGSLYDRDGFLRE